MDLDSSVVPTSSGVLIVFILIFLFCFCCRKHQQRSRQQDRNAAGGRPRGRRQKNARRKWRRRRQNNDDGRVAILDHEAGLPEESAVPVAGQIPYAGQPSNPNHYVINLNPPCQMPFQAAHYPPPGPFHPHQQHPWQQVVQNPQFPPPPHANGTFPQDPCYPYDQHQPEGFAQLYAQAQPDMNVFPQPPPPYETEPFPPLPSRQK